MTVVVGYRDCLQENEGTEESEDRRRLNSKTAEQRSRLRQKKTRNGIKCTQGHFRLDSE